MRYPESKPDAAARHLAALVRSVRSCPFSGNRAQQRIAQIFRDSSADGRLLPSDSRDLCIPLLKELLTLPNHFNAQVIATHGFLRVCECR